MSDLAELIKRLEAATEGSRELDVEIGEAIGAADHSGPAWDRPYKYWSLHYTTSLDAALTLVPTDWAWWEVGKYMAEASPLRAFGDGMPYRAKIGKTWGDTTAWGSGMSGALALCIAALKSRCV